MIEVKDLVKVYPGGKRAVDGIGFSVPRGEFFGFLGPNGAGKSTTLKILGTLLKKTSGEVVVAGHSVERQPDKVRRNIGFAMQEVGLDDLVTGREFLVLQGLLYKLPAAEARKRAAGLLDMMGLTGAASRKIGTYSGGMRRRIDLLGALIHRPPLLFLDEPTTGLDPQSRLAIWDYLRQLNREGMTIVLTTQLMEEADQLCQRLAIIDIGRIVAEGSPAGLKAQVGGDVVTIGVDGGASLGEALEVLKGLPYVLGGELCEGKARVTVKDSKSVVPEMIGVLHRSGFSVSNLSVAEPTLDDVFLGYTGKTIREDKGGGDEVSQMMRPWLGLKR